MFTGIITRTTEVVSSKLGDRGLTLTFKKPKGWDDLEEGESVCTDGVCLTVAAIRDDEYDCFLMPETLMKTSFGDKVPKFVSLERAMSAKGKFSGHFVQGHVDGVGRVSKIDKSDGWRLSIDFAKEHKNLVILKGSIAINGVSLTVAELHGHTFGVAIIPHTLKHTTLSDLEMGDEVNLEFDMIGKYIVRIMEAKENDSERIEG